MFQEFRLVKRNRHKYRTSFGGYELLLKNFGNITLRTSIF